MAISKKKAAKKRSKYATADGRSYLTKRIAVARARAAGRRAAANAMAVMGFVVTTQGQQLVRKYDDGHVETIGNI